MASGWAKGKNKDGPRKEMDTWVGMRMTKVEKRDHYCQGLWSQVQYQCRFMRQSGCNNEPFLDVVCSQTPEMCISAHTVMMLGRIIQVKNVAEAELKSSGSREALSLAGMKTR